MSLFESLTKRFFKDKEQLDTSLIDPTRIKDVIDDTDLSTLIPQHLIPQQLKSNNLTNEQNIIRYRKLAGAADPSVYIEEIITEVYNAEREDIPKLKIKDYEVPATLDKKLQEAHEKICSMLNFKRKGHDLIRQWFVDGHLFVECVYDNNNLKNGIIDLLILDPRGMVKEFSDHLKRHVYKYSSTNNQSFYGTFHGKQYEKEQLVHIWSEMVDEKNQPVGFLHPAIKPANQMHLIEDMLVVYRFTRGFEKRAIKVNVGNMPKAKAITYMSELVNRFRNKRTYNSETGDVDNNSHIMAVTDDLWLPTKNGTKDIEIDTLQGGMQLGELEDVNYFRGKLLTAMKIPASRFKDDANPFDISATEITGQEKRFAKYISSLRGKFNEIFTELIKREMICTKAMNEEEFELLRGHLSYVYPDETTLARKEFYVGLNKKIEAIQSVDSYVGKYFTEEYIHTEILDRTQAEYEEFKEKVKKEHAAKMSNMSADFGLGNQDTQDSDATEETPEKEETK